MKETIIIIVLLIILITFIIINSNEVTFEKSANNNTFLVRNLDDKKIAADLLAEIRLKLKKLIDNIEKSDGTIDDYLFIEPYLRTIKSKFNNIIFRESSPNSKFTSYSINKGEEIVFCLRSKEDNHFHDINEILYVAIHEISHVGCPEIGHTPLFTKININLLRYAVKFGIYNYKNYNLFPEEYCGIQLSTNILN